MIYFDKTIRTRLIERFWQLLAPGGTLFIGHAESLTGIQHRYRYIQPTIYEKV
jgi:chemotaxis protein methyltransferase CheR